MVSLPLIAQNSNPIFIGDISPEVKESILSNHNSNLYNLLLNRLRQLPTQILCDDTLWNNNDTILGCDWSNIPWNEFVGYLSLPNFPHCMLMVSYRVRICPNNPLVRQIDLVDFIPVLYDPQCDSLYNYLNSGDEYQQATKLHEIRNDLNLLISQFEVAQMSSIPPCDSTGNMLQYVFYKEIACQAYVKFLYQPDSIQCAPFYYIPPSPFICSRDAVCCKTTVSFCQDSFGNTNPQITKELIGTYCDNYPVELDFEDFLNFLNMSGTVLDIVLLPCFNVCE